MPPKRDNRALPQKEAKLFREVLNDYENRQYKKGLKSCEAILKKHPDHGETLCMKGIILYNSGRKEEGHQLVRKGVSLDITSHICWHVKALMHKAERDLEQAMACYTQALKHERDQVNIIRDLVNIQLQFRFYSDAIEHRINMLRIQPKHRAHWLGLAVALHLSGNLDRAAHVLSLFAEIQAGTTAVYDYDASELALYRALILEEMGRPQQALEVLDAETNVLDCTALEQSRARLYAQMGDTPAALTHLASMLHRNADNIETLRDFLAAHDLTLGHIVDTDRSRCLDLLDGLTVEYPRSLIVQRAALQVAEGDEFKSRVERHLRHAISTGIPSLYADLRPLYKDSAKRSVIESVVEAYVVSLRQNESPAAVVWAEFFLALHYTALGRHQQALDHINSAIEHTPSLPDLYVVRARILKRAGSPLAAHKSMEFARSLDGQDRYLNCKAAKYLCRIDRPEDAEALVGLFTRKEANTPLSDLIDMQALWFLIEQGEAFRRQGRLHLALKRFHQIDKVFNDWSDDEYDFHSWSLRKLTLRAYVGMVRRGNSLRCHDIYYRASMGAVEIYLQVHQEHAAQLNGVHLNGDAFNRTAGASGIDKNQKQTKKVKAKSLEPHKANSTSAVTGASAQSEDSSALDEDPEGHLLLQSTTPLASAAKFVESLEHACPLRCATWVMSARLARAQERPLQCVRALKRARAIDPYDANLNVQISGLRAWLQSNSDPFFHRAAQTLVPDSSEESVITALSHDGKQSAKRILTSCRARWAVGGSKTDVECLVFQILSSALDDDVRTMIDAYHLLRDDMGSLRADEFRVAGHVRFPLATAFFSREQHQAHLDSLAASDIAADVERLSLDPHSDLQGLQQ